MKQIIDYDLIYYHLPEEFVQLARKAIREGWIPVGGMQIGVVSSLSIYMQTVVKKSNHLCGGAFGESQNTLT